MRQLSVTILLVWLSLSANAQCPDGAYITHNSFCLFLSWTNPPAPLPGTVSADEGDYLLISGSGTEDDPAIYKNGGGGGSCSSAQYPYQGTLEINGNNCAYSEGVLPVTLLGFSIMKAGTGKTILTWSLAGAGNMKVIEVQKSPDGVSWDRLASIDPKEGTADERGIQSYTYRDAETGTPMVYYRLKMIYADHTFEWSNVLSIATTEKQDFELTYNAGRIEVSFPEHTVAYVRVYDISGKEMEGAVEAIQNGKVFVDLGFFASGLYIIQCASPGGRAAFKVFR